MVLARQDVPTSTRQRQRKARFRLASTNVVSQFFFLWVFRLVQVSAAAADIRNVNLVLAKSETAAATGDRLEKIWKRECAAGQPSIRKCLFEAFGRAYLPLALWKLAWLSIAWLGTAYFLTNLIKLNDPKSATTLQNGLLLALGLLACGFFGSLCFHQLIVQTTRIAIRCRAALMVLIYRKSLRLSYVKGGVSNIVNLISSECNQIAEACVHWHSFWSAAVHCVVLVIILWLLIGVVSLVPFTFIIFLVIPLQYMLALWTSNVSGPLTDSITKRVHLMSEVLTAVIFFDK